MPSMIRVALVDDHPVVRDGLIALLRDEPGFELAGSFGDADALFASLPASRPDVVILDLEMPGTSAVTAIERLQREMPSVRVVVFTAYDIDDIVLAALRSGARAYVRKGAPADEVVRAMREVHAGGTYLQPPVAAKIAGLLSDKDPMAALTPREHEVLRLVSDGLSNKQIAASLGITERTVKFHVSSLMAKLGCGNRMQIAKFASRRRR